MHCKQFFSNSAAQNSEPYKGNQDIKEDGSAQLVVLRVTAETSAYLESKRMGPSRRGRGLPSNPAAEVLWYVISSQKRNYQQIEEWQLYQPGKKRHKADPGNCKLVSPTSVAGKWLKSQLIIEL